MIRTEKITQCHKKGEGGRWCSETGPDPVGLSALIGYVVRTESRHPASICG